MTDKNLLDRLSRVIKIKPQDDLRRPNQNSWSGNSKLLSNEHKIYAIKISDGEKERKSTDYQQIAVKKRKPASLLVKRWIEKCKWKVPRAVLIVSVLQVRIGRSNFVYLISNIKIRN